MSKKDSITPLKAAENDSPLSARPILPPASIVPVPAPPLLSNPEPEGQEGDPPNSSAKEEGEGAPVPDLLTSEELLKQCEALKQQLADVQAQQAQGKAAKAAATKAARDAAKATKEAAKAAGKPQAKSGTKRKGAEDCDPQKDQGNKGDEKKSEYELQRDRSVNENNEKLKALGIPVPEPEPAKKSRAKRPKAQKAEEPEEPLTVTAVPYEESELFKECPPLPEASVADLQVTWRATQIAPR